MTCRFKTQNVQNVQIMCGFCRLEALIFLTFVRFVRPVRCFYTHIYIRRYIARVTQGKTRYV